jgi:spoIIIJ-associated protein
MHTSPMESAHIQKIKEFIQEAARHMQIPCEIDVSADEGGVVQVAIQASDDGRLLIGKNGQNLKALEHVVRILCLRQNPEFRAVTVDVNNYRAERTNELVRIVHETAVRVRETRRSEALDPMVAHERRIVHTELAAYGDLSTESIGIDPNRRVVIKPL